MNEVVSVTVTAMNGVVIMVKLIKKLNFSFQRQLFKRNED